MFIRLCGLVLALSALACASAGAQDPPKGRAAFTEHVAALLRSETEAAVVVAGPLTLKVGDLQANLDRIYAYCDREPRGCAREVSTYVKGVAQAHKDRSAPASREAVRILVRTRAYVAMSQAALPKEAPKLQPRALAGALVMLPAIDMPRAVRLLADKDNQDLGLSADEVFQLGLANLRKQLKPLMQVAKVVQPGQIGNLSGDTYHSSRLALRESWSPLAKAHGGKLIVAVPATDTVLYVGDDSPTAIDALRALAKNVWARAPNQLSSE